MITPHLSVSERPGLGLSSILPKERIATTYTLFEVTALVSIPAQWRIPVNAGHSSIELGL
jgi:hypothetical protein